MHFNIVRTAIVFAILLLSGGALFAQTITGVVKDAETQEPLADANIIQPGTNNGVATRSDGTFTITLLSGESQQLKVSYVGYKQKTIPIEGPDKEIVVLLEPDPEAGLEKMLVLGTRADENDPVTQTTIDIREIEDSYVGQDPSVVLQQHAPSIISYSDAGANIGNYVQFRMRGIDQTRINTTLNGVPLSDMIDQGVFFSNFSDFANSVQSVQVQRGVGTSGNGTASYAGSVNFESISLNRPSPEFGGDVTFGSFNTLRAAGEVHTGKLKNDMAFYSRFTRTISDGFKNHSGSDSHSLFLSGGYLGSNHVLKVTAFAGKTQNDQAYLPVLLSDIRNDPETNYNSANDTDDFEQEMMQLQHSTSLNEDLTLSSTLYYGGARGFFPFSLSPANQLIFRLENDHYGFMSDINYEQSNVHLKAGVHGYLFRRENINSTAPNTSNPDYRDETDKDELSFFTKADVQAGNVNLFADLQVRYVQMDFRADEVVSFGGPVPPNGVDTGRDWLFLNPKVGVNYAFNGRSSAYVSFGRTSREPTRTDILQGDGTAITEANLASVRNENIVEEEHVNDLEAGFRYQGERVSLKTNFFYMDFEDEISLVGALAQNSYVPLRQNVPESFRTGVELNGSARLGERWEATLDATFLQTNVSRFVNASGQVFRDVEHIFSPDWIIHPGLRFEPTDGLGVGINVRYVSESFMELSNDPGFTIPEYVVVDGQVDLTLSENARINILINNIFDELYFTDGAPVDRDFDGTVEGPGYRVQPPFNIYGQLKLQF